MAEIFPARAQRVTVFGLTRNRTATSAGVSNSFRSVAVITSPIRGFRTLRIGQRRTRLNSPDGRFWPGRTRRSGLIGDPPLLPTDLGRADDRSASGRFLLAPSAFYPRA